MIYSVTVFLIILKLKIVKLLIIPFKCPVAIFDAMFVPAPGPQILSTYGIRLVSNTLFCDSMQFIFMPFSNIHIIKILFFLNINYESHTVFLTLRIQITSVLYIFFFMLPFNKYEPFLDCLKFRLEQPLIFFSFSEAKNGTWLHLKAVVSLQCLLRFFLHDLFKMLMRGSCCLVVMCL